MKQALGLLAEALLLSFAGFMVARLAADEPPAPGAPVFRHAEVVWRMDLLVAPTDPHPTSPAKVATLLGWTEAATASSAQRVGGA